MSDAEIDELYERSKDDRAIELTPWQLHREGKCSGVPRCEVCVIVTARRDSP
jgi:hypothetical protein